jgi:hypothetical protein
MKSQIFVFVAAIMAAVACGSENTGKSSRLLDNTPIIRPQGDPDYKNKDGVAIMDWVKKPAVRKSICEVIRKAVSQGYKGVSNESFNLVAETFTLHPIEAEIVALYSIEFECSDIR